MTTLTIQQVLDLKPCAVYTEERLLEVFDGRTEIDARSALELKISDFDKLWVIQAGKLMSDEYLAGLTNRIAGLITNPDDPHVVRYRTQVGNTIYAFGQIAHGYAQQEGMDFKTARDFILSFVMADVTAALQ